MPTPLYSLARQPLIHFLILATALFYLFNIFGKSDASDTENKITLQEEALLEFVQYRNAAFNRAAAIHYLTQLDEAAYQRLINDYVQQEALYREAKKLGLENDDYVIKQRLIQKMQYLARGFGPEDTALSDEQLQTYFSDNASDYFQATSYTFTHVFFDHSKPGAQQRAMATLPQLNTGKIGFSEALPLGDRFLFHRYYVERDSDFIAAHFGEAFTEALIQIQPNTEHWSGPIASDYGWHLVMVAKQRSGGTPDFTEVRDKVAHDARQRQIEEQVEQYVEAVIANYEVVRPAIDIRAALDTDYAHQQDPEQ